MRTFVLLSLLSTLLLACGKSDDSKPWPTPASNSTESTTPPAGSQAPASAEAPEEHAEAPAPAKPAAAEPDRVTVDHILIGVKSDRFKQGRYTVDQARQIAYDLLMRIQNGADWAELKKEYSDDPPPGGPYTLANGSNTSEPGVHPRSGMVKAFGDVAFSEKVGEVEIANYDPVTCPFGFHIIKRIK